MFERLLSIGVNASNSEALNRKIRTANLIACVTIAILTLYSPLFFFIFHPVDVVVFLVFYTTAVLNFFLVKNKQYIWAFTSNIVAAYLFFIWGTIAYGWSANLQYYLLSMCMIVVIFYDDKRILKLYIVAAIVLFFTLLYFRKNERGVLNIPQEFDLVVENLGYFNLFTLFVIVSVLILFFKNENLKYQERVLEINKVIEEKNKEMLDSIHYAQRLQTGLLQAKTEFIQLLPGSFLFFKPKDIVSGDFYWFHQTNECVYVACGDCTGHGVPGALMSVLGMNVLADVVENKKASYTDEVLNQLRNGIVKSLNKEKTVGEYKDGMDISLVKIDKQSLTCEYAGANNSIYHISNGHVSEYKPTKQPVGYSANPVPFTRTVFEIKPNDYVILFTDGFADQFGGEFNKKFMYKPFKELLVSALKEQEANIEQVLESTLSSWKMNNEQTDDICIMGIRI